MKEKIQSTTIEKLRKAIELLGEALSIIDNIQPIVKSPVCDQLCDIGEDIDSTLTKLSKLGNSTAERVPMYAIGQDDGNGGCGMWHGPDPSEQDMLDVEGRDENSVIIRFNTDGTDEEMYRWAVMEWIRVIRE